MEALLRNEFTNKSDIWSYGITIWEILTAGEQPYQGLNYHQVNFINLTCFYFQLKFEFSDKLFKFKGFGFFKIWSTIELSK